MHKFVKFFYIFLIVLSVVFVASGVFADQPNPYKTICHHTPGNEVTIDFINQQSYDGHLGTPHNDQTYDTEGPCADTSPTGTPTLTPTPTEEPNEDKVTLCHSNNGIKEYSEITISTSAAYNGHLGNGHQNGEDIIPPFEYQNNTYSQNWDANGQATLRNHCVPTEVTLTPTPTITAPTPTPTTTPSGGTGGGESSTSSTSQGGETLGVTSPTKAVLGLSATGSRNNSSYVLIQVLSSLLLSSVGLRLFKKNA